MKHAMLMVIILAGTLVPGLARMWTSSDGKKIEAEFVRVDGEVAVVKMKGKTVRIPFERLSEEDVVFLKEEAAKAKKGTGRLFGIELKAGEVVDADEFLEEKMKETLAASDFKPTKIVVRMTIPDDFDPTKPQKVFWMVGGFDNDADRRRGNIGMFRRGQTALEKGWIVIAADTNMGNPRRKIGGVSEADAEFHYFLVNELAKAWPDFRSWKHACGGHSTGAQATFFRMAQLMQAGANVVGGFFSGCTKGMTRVASQEAKIRSDVWKEVKGFQSTGDQDGIAEARHVKSVGEEMRRGGLKNVRSKTFPGNHTMSDELFGEALDWFAEEE